MFDSLEEWVEEKWISLYLTQINIFRLYQMKSKQDTWSSEGIQSPEEAPLFLDPIYVLHRFFKAVFPKMDFTDHLHQPPGDVY